MKACGRQDPHQCRMGAHLAQPTCAHCAAPDVIRGDGGMTLVCPRCIAALGHVVAAPFSAAPRTRLDLLEAHLDVVDLLMGRWRFTSSWPGAGDMRLVTGEVAR